MTAMRVLMLRDGYDALSVRDIIDQANIGRSTFYEHFANKADVLRESLLFVLTPLADILSPAASLPRLTLVLQHFWDMRPVASIVLTGTTHALTVEILSGLIEARLAERRDHKVPRRIPAALAARALAELQLGLIGGWLSAGETFGAEALAATLLATTNASASPLLA